LVLFFQKRTASSFDFQQQAARVFQAFLDAHQEGDGFAAVYDAVVVGHG
jgi:hypothetical protein